jgi:hypothetical protein
VNQVLPHFIPETFVPVYIYSTHIHRGWVLILRIYTGKFGKEELETVM